MNRVEQTGEALADFLQVFLGQLDASDSLREPEKGLDHQLDGVVNTKHGQSAIGVGVVFE